MAAAMRWDGTSKRDTFVFDNDFDSFDFVKAGRGNDFISDGANDGFWSSDQFFGERGSDTLISNDGDDLLRGGQGNDRIIVNAGWYDPAEMQFHAPGTKHEKIGFTTTVFGGSGRDTLEMKMSDIRSIDHQGDLTIIHTAHHGSVTVTGVEEFLFL